MKAIIDLAAPAARLDRAEAAGDTGWDAAPLWSRMRTAHAHEGHERCDRPVPLTAAAGFPPRLFDQRLDERFDLSALERLTVGSRPLRRGRTGRGRDGHACLQSSIALVSLAQ